MINIRELQGELFTKFCILNYEEIKRRRKARGKLDFARVTPTKRTMLLELEKLEITLDKMFEAFYKKQLGLTK